MKKISFTVLFVVLGLALIAGGAALLVGIAHSRDAGIILPPSAAQAAQTAAPSAAASPVVSGEPIRIAIPSLHINLPVIPGTYNARTRQWTLTLDKVQYASMTPEPNTQSGDTFLYGHYRTGVFASLHTIQPNAQAVITTDNGHTFYYQLNSIKVVSPQDSSVVFDYTGPPILTLQTCTGLFFQNRQLFTFNLVKAA